MIGTGLKKWSPPNWSILDVADAMSLIGMEDVLLANMACLENTGMVKIQCLKISNTLFHTFFFFCQNFAFNAVVS